MTTASTGAAEPLARITAGGEPGLSRVSPEEVVAGLREHGAVLVAGHGASLEEFIGLSDALGHDWGDYRGGGFRYTSLDRRSIDPAGTVLTATGETQEFPVPLHGEMYYLPRQPRLLWFMCAVPPPDGVGGETTLCDGSALLERLSPETRGYLEANRLAYRRLLRSGEWQETFGTDDVEVARARCAENETALEHDPETDSVRTVYVTSAILPGPDGRPGYMGSLMPVYFAEAGRRQQIAATGQGELPPLTVRAEDGGEIPMAVVHEALAAGSAMETAVPWSAGDVLVVDNARVLHGRTASQSPERMVYVRMGEARFAL